MSVCQAVCWEWQRDDGGFCPYVPEDSSVLETAYASGKSQCQCTGGLYVVDFPKLTQRRKTGGGKRKVQRVSIQLPSTNISAYWMWSEYPGQFASYHTDATVDIELAYQRGESQVDLSQKPSKLPYTIDLVNMFQTRHHYNTRRAIKRVPLAAGDSLQQLLKPASSVGSLANGMPTGPPAYMGSGSGLMLGPTSGIPPVSSYAGHAPHYGSGLMPGATPISGSPFGGGATTGFGASASSYHTHPAMGVSPHLGYASGHTPGLNPVLHTHSSTYKTSATTFSGRNISSSSISSIPSSSSLAGHRSSATISSGLSSNPPAAATRSKTGSRKTAVAASGKTTTAASAGVPKKSSGKGKSRTKAKPQKASHVMGGDNGDMSVYARRVTRLRPKGDEPCPICMNKLSEQSGFEDDDAVPSAPGTLDVYRLRKCGHKLHTPCLAMYVKNCSKGGFQCPTCKKPYGVKMGDMPDGKMTVRTMPGSLPGHAGCDTIQITYNFTAGCYNGKHYKANGFPRTCYLPNSAKGQRVLKLLKVAWDRRLTFTIGTSVTTGAMDTVVWNEIHHKTESHSNSSGHGYPDPLYLDRVMLEMVAQGVTEEDEEEGEDVESSESSEEEEEEEEAPPVTRYIGTYRTGTSTYISTAGSDESL